MNTENPYYLGEFITSSPCISLYPKVSVNDVISIDGNVSSLGNGMNGDLLFYNHSSEDPYSKYYNYPLVGNDKEFDGNLGVIDITPNDYNLGYPINTHYTPHGEYSEVAEDLQRYLDYSYLQKYYTDQVNYIDDNENRHINDQIETTPKRRKRKIGIKKQTNEYKKNYIKRVQITPKKWAKHHKMVTRTSIITSDELDKSELSISEPIELKHEEEKTPDIITHQEIIPKIELQEHDLIPYQGVTYYINSYTILVFGTKKYRRNSKSLTCIILSVPKEATSRQHITIKYLLNYHQPFIPTINLLESLKTHETFLKFCKDAKLVNKPNKIFSKVIQQLGKPLEYNESDSPNKFKKKKFKRSWKPDSINASNASKYINQVKPKPLGNWAGFFCGDYKTQTSVHPDYVQGLYLVDIDDIAIDLDDFEHQFKWEIDLLWDRNEILLEEKNSWYKLGGLDNECLEYHKLSRERYEKNNEFYGYPDTQLDYPDNHVIGNFNVINPPPNFTPLPPFIEPKLKYPRAQEYRGARTSYIKELDQDFLFKLSLHFPHEFINS